jgi:hypothetical protein
MIVTDNSPEKNDVEIRDITSRDILSRVISFNTETKEAELYAVLVQGRTKKVSVAFDKPLVINGEARNPVTFKCVLSNYALYSRITGKEVNDANPNIYGDGEVIITTGNSTFPSPTDLE